MAARLDSGRKLALDQAFVRRYGTTTQGAAAVVGARGPQIPVVTVPVPGSRTPDIPPITTPVPRMDQLPVPPPWVRAFHRLTYGITPTAIQEFNALGANASARYLAMVEQQLAWETIDDSAMNARLSSAGYTTFGKTLPQLWNDHVATGPDYNTRMRPAWEVQRAAIARAVHSKRQLLERVVTFWHDHFNVQAGDYDAGPVFVHYHRDVIRANAFGNFRTMLEAVARSTSMMYYLDNRSNTRSGPNENFARELLELHTFGAENYLGFMSPFNVPPCPEDPDYPIGYTDIDVYETASAFTGWTVNTGSGGDGTFVYRANNHDSGPKFVLGLFINPEQPALKDGRDILDRVASHPRVAKFICRKLIRHFVTDEPPQALVDSAAEIFRANWQSAEQIRMTLRHILRSDLARDAWNMKRRRPNELVAAAFRASGSQFTFRLDNPRSNDLNYQLGFTGHVPYDWPAPNGYPDNANAWSGSNSFAMSWRLLGWMSDALDDQTRLLPIIETSRAQVPSWTARNLVTFWCDRILGHQPRPSRVSVLLAHMAQNGNADSFVIADTNEWKGNDLKAHYNHDRLRNMVSLLLMSPEFFNR